MSTASPPVRIERLVAETFTAAGRAWEAHDALVAALAQRGGLARREAEREIDRLVALGMLDAITICHCPPGAQRMVVEAAYQPGPRLSRGAAQPTTEAAAG